MQLACQLVQEGESWVFFCKVPWPKLFHRQTAALPQRLVIWCRACNQSPAFPSQAEEHEVQFVSSCPAHRSLQIRRPRSLPSPAAHQACSRPPLDPTAVDPRGSAKKSGRSREPLARELSEPWPEVPRARALGPPSVRPSAVRSFLVKLGGWDFVSGPRDTNLANVSSLPAFSGLAADERHHAGANLRTAGVA